MNRMGLTLKEDFKQKFFTKLLLAAVLGVAFCFCMDVLNDLPFLWRVKRGDMMIHYYLFNSYTFGGQYLPYFALVLSAMIGTVDYCKEVNSGADRYVIQRLGSIRRYAVSKVLFTILTSGFIYVIGIVVFVLGAGIFQPFYEHSRDMEMQGFPYFKFLSSGNGWSYFFIILYLAFLKAVLYNMIALWISAYVKNVYIVMAVPVLAVYVFTRLFIIFKVAPQLRLDWWLDARVVWNSDIQTLVSCTIVVIGLCVACGIGFVRKVKTDEERK